MGQEESPQRCLNILNACCELHPILLIGYKKMHDIGPCRFYLNRRIMCRIMSGMVEQFDPRAEFATARPLEGSIQCRLREEKGSSHVRDRQQTLLLHCCSVGNVVLEKYVEGTWRAGLN